MRSLFASVVLVAAALVLAAGTNLAQDKKDVVLKGNITCAKCELKVEKKCATVIVVREKDKDIVFYFDKAGHKEHHGKICEAGKKGTVEGTVSEVEKKKIITVKKVTFD